MRNDSDKKTTSSAEHPPEGATADASAKKYDFVVRPAEAGQRLDILLAYHLSDITRTMLAGLVRSGYVLIDGQGRKAGYRVKAQEAVSVIVPPPAQAKITPEEIYFHVIHEDDDLIVVSKPPGLVVHPSCGHQAGTLVHGLLARCRNLSGISGEQRPGIVHRLDKDTSGIMVAAKNDRTHQALQKLFKQREIVKIYHAIVSGRPKNASGRIVSSLGRHPVHRKKMAVLDQGGREAASNWKIIEELPCGLSYMELRPETGRTHQLRVHMASIGNPIVGDILYGSRKNNICAKLEIKRMCLHAYSLSFTHPGTGKAVSFRAPLWPDILELLDRMRMMQKNNDT